jgi:hypothetical protein
VHEPHGGGPVWWQPGSNRFYLRVSRQDEVGGGDDAGELNAGAGRLQPVPQVTSPVTVNLDQVTESTTCSCNAGDDNPN